jgi:16S rRNA processing protein RimM
MVVKLNGVDDRDRAESLRGSILRLQRKFCKTLPGGSFYVFDLIGLKVVTAAGETVGEVRDVLMLPAQPVLVVIHGEKEVLIPAVKTFVHQVDLQSRTLMVEPIEGLLDGNDH